MIISSLTDNGRKFEPDERGDFFVLETLATIRCTTCGEEGSICDKVDEQLLALGGAGLDSVRVSSLVNAAMMAALQHRCPWRARLKAWWSNLKRWFSKGA